jgi:hypothetical protein
LRHLRLWLLLIGLLSLAAEVVAAAAVFWRGAASRASEGSERLDVRTATQRPRSGG